MKRKDKAYRVGLILDRLYPETPIPLDHYSAYTLLVAVMLSAQTTDKKVNQVTPKLFQYADTPESAWKKILQFNKHLANKPAEEIAPDGISDE